MICNLQIIFSFHKKNMRTLYTSVLPCFLFCPHIFLILQSRTRCWCCFSAVLPYKVKFHRLSCYFCIEKISQCPWHKMQIYSISFFPWKYIVRLKAFLHYLLNIHPYIIVKFYNNITSAFFCKCNINTKTKTKDYGNNTNHSFFANYWRIILDKQNIFNACTKPCCTISIFFFQYWRRWTKKIKTFK